MDIFRVNQDSKNVRLEQINLGNPVSFQPMIILTDTTLDAIGMKRALVEGLNVDTSLSDIILTLPSAQTVYEILPSISEGTTYYIYLSISQNALNSLTVTGGTGINFPSGNIIGPTTSKLILLILKENTEIDIVFDNSPFGELVSTPLEIDTSTVLTVDQAQQAFFNGIVADTQSGSITITTPSAADIISAYPSITVGRMFKIGVSVKENTTNTATLIGGTGVTIDNAGINICCINNNVISGGETRIFTGLVTNVTSGSEAILVTPSYYPLTDVFFNGSILETCDVQVTSDGVDVTLSIQLVGGADIHLIMNGRLYRFSASTVTLIAGSDTSPTRNYVYIPYSTQVLTVSTVDFPTAEQYIPIADCIVQSATGVQTDGVYKLQIMISDLVNDTGMGHIDHINEWIRLQYATWSSGVFPTTTIVVNVASIDNVYFASTSGVIYQIEPNSFPALNMQTGDPAFVINDFSTAYLRITDLGDIDTDSTGATLRNNNTYYSLVIWGITSEDQADCHLIVNVPSGSYSSSLNAINDVNKYDNYTIPVAYKGTGFLIARITLRYQTAASGTFTEEQTEDLRGTNPSAVAGSGTVTGASTFSDNLFRVYNVADNTKQVALDVSPVSAATTRTISIANRDLDLANPLFDTTQITSSATTGDLLSVTGDSLTTGDAVSISSNSADISSRNLIKVVNDNVASTGTTAVYIQQDSTGLALDIRGDTSILSTNPTVNSLNIVNDSLTTASLISATSNSADTSVRNLVEIVNDNTLATGVTTLYVQQDSTGLGIDVLGDGRFTTSATTGDGLEIIADNLTTGAGLSVTSNSANTGNRNLVYFNNQNVSSTNTTVLNINQQSPSRAVFALSASTDSNSWTIFNSSLTTGTGFYVRDTSADTGIRYSNRFTTENASATGTTTMSIEQSSTGLALNVLGNTNITSTNTAGDTLGITNNSLTTASALSILSNSADTSVRNLVEIVNDNTLATGVTALYVQQDSTGLGIDVRGNGYVGGELQVEDPGSGTPYSATYLQLYNVSAHEASPTDVTFSQDGLRMYVSGLGVRGVTQYSLSTAWNIATSVFVQSYNASAHGNSQQAVRFRDDGLKMYIAESSTASVHEYALGTAWDISTAVWTLGFSTAAQDTFCAGLAFSQDGTRMYISGNNTDSIIQYSLTTAWSLAAVSYIQSYSVASIDNAPFGVHLRPDGFVMVVAGNQHDSLYIFYLTTAWDVSTASLYLTINVTTHDTVPNGIYLRPDSSKIYHSGFANSSVFEYDLAFAYGIVYSGGPTGIYFDSGGKVGIGTITPSTTIDIQGDANISGKLTVAGGIDPYCLQIQEKSNIPLTPSSGYGYVWVKNTSPNKVYFTDGSGTNYAVTLVDSSSLLTQGSILFANSGGNISQDNSNLFWDDSNNRLGLGTNTPSVTFEIHGTDSSYSQGPTLLCMTSIDAYPQFELLPLTHGNVNLLFDSYYDGSYRSSNASSNYVISKTTNQLQFLYNSGVAQGSITSLKHGLTIDQMGNITISNPTDNGYLKLNTGDGDKIILTTIGTAGSKISHAAGWNVQYYAGSGITAPAQGFHSLYTTEGSVYVERNRITSQGADYLYSTVAAGTSVVEVRKNNNSSTNNDCLAFQRGATSVTGGGTTQGVLRLDGAGNFVTVTISDSRLKTNIEKDDNETYEIVKNLPNRKFDWIPDDMPKNCRGFISQEVEEFVPTAVTQLGSQYGFDNVLGVSAPSLIPVLWGAVRKLIAKVEDLEVQLASYKTNL